MELRPDLSCLWKLLGDACTAVSTVSPNRAQIAVPAPLAGLDPNTQSHTLNQAQILKVGERYDRKEAFSYAAFLHHDCSVKAYTVTKKLPSFPLNHRLTVHVFVCRCYARALKLTSEVPSLWYDLGLNYYRQSSLSCPTEGDENSPSLLLEKAEQVIYRILCTDTCIVCSLSWSYESFSSLFSV